MATFALWLGFKVLCLTSVLSLVLAFRSRGPAAQRPHRVSRRTSSTSCAPAAAACTVITCAVIVIIIRA